MWPVITAIKLILLTRHTSYCRCVGCAHSPRSHRYLCSWDSCLTAFLQPELFRVNLGWYEYDGGITAL